MPKPKPPSDADEKLALPARIMTFGCKPPDVGAATFSEQLFLAHRYKNKLIEIDRARRDKFRAIRSSYAPRLVELEAALKELNEQIEAGLAHIKQRKHREKELDKAIVERDRIMQSGSAVPEKLLSQIAQLPGMLAEADKAAIEVPVLKAERKKLGDEAKAERLAFNELIDPARVEFKRRVEAEGAAFMATTGRSKIGARTTEKHNTTVRQAMLEEPEWSAAWKEVARSEELFSEMGKKARAECGVNPGTYLLVEATMEAARKAAVGDVRFVRYNGEGRIGVQLKHTTVGECRNGTSRFLQFGPGKPTKKGVNKPEYQRVMIRVGSSGRKPVWAELPVRIHRPIPDAAEIRWAWILVRRQGPRLIYKLQLTLRTQSLVPERRGQGACAVNLGWRRTDKGLRVGYVTATAGEERSIECDPKSLELFEFCDSLRAITDRHFDEVRATLKSWREGRPSDAEPEWLAGAVEFMGNWRSHAKLARIARVWVAEIADPDLLRWCWAKWRRERLAAGLDLFCTFGEFSDWLRQIEGAEEADWRMALWLEWWRRKDDHLWLWQANERQRAVKRRRQAYRLVAISLAERYETLVYDDTDLRKLADLSKDASDLVAIARYQRTVAAPSELRSQLLEVFGAERVVKVTAKRNTIEHAACGGAMRDEPDMLYLACAKCGTVVDRDANNCENQLIRAGFVPAPKRRRAQ